MNTPDETPGDELTRDYRRASEADAGSPSAATRAAILAEARAAALRRTPAANDSRYLWRAAAGVAVLGVAVILWRQANPDLTRDLSVATREKAVAETAPPATPTLPAADVAQPGAAGAGVVADNRAAPAVLAAEAPAPSRTLKEESEAQLKAEPAPPAARTREAPAENAVVMSDASQANVRLARASAEAGPPTVAMGAVQAAGAIRKDGIDYQQLLQREFPEVWNGNEPPHTVWVVMDAAGKVLRKGGLSPGATITRDQPFESERPWQMFGVTTASGSSLQLAVMHIN
jgi:hypothetical protein